MYNPRTAQANPQRNESLVRRSLVLLAIPVILITATPHMTAESSAPPTVRLPHSGWEEVGKGSATGRGVFPVMHSEFYGPDIAAASDDGLLAAAYFQGHSVIPYSVWDGTRWKAGTIGVLHANTDAVKPSLAAATDGSYLAAWTRHTWTPAVSEDSQVAAARWNGATWVPAGTEGRFEVTDDRGFLCCPSLATGPDGTGYLAWRSSGAGGGPGWIYVRKSVGTAWQEMDNSASGYGISGIEGLAGSPSVAISDDGTVYVAWERFES